MWWFESSNFSEGEIKTQHKKEKSWDSNNYNRQKKELQQAEQEEKNTEEDLENILLALGENKYTELYDSMKQQEEARQKEMRQEMEYCLQTGIMRNFPYNFLNEKTGEQDTVNFKVCNDMQTIQFWNEKEWNIGTIRLINIEPQEWEVECHLYSGTQKSQCWKSIWECIEKAIGFCVQ